MPSRVAERTMRGWVAGQWEALEPEGRSSKSLLVAPWMMIYLISWPGMSSLYLTTEDWDHQVVISVQVAESFHIASKFLKVLACCHRSINRERI